ncbi:MAG: RHS repeat-associated core domain-containing protein [Thermoleophilia bacterium]
MATTSFFYDAASRLTSSTYLPDLEGASPTTTYYGWDTANAWRTSQGPNANPTQANEPIDFSYNAQGRMSAYANADTSANASYTYDAAGQRTKSVVTVGTTTTTSFAYEGLTLLKLAATQGATTWRIDYLSDVEGVPYGGVYRSPASSTSPTYFSLVTSDRGDVLELCDADGNAFAAYRYDAWGSPQGAGSYATGIWTQSTSLVTSTLAGQIASRQNLRYAGYAFDAESGLYYCSARYYDPATRQWTSGDPAKADGEESAYQYCGGEPVGRLDASGMYAHAFVPSAHVDQTRYFLKVMQVDAGRVKAQWGAMWWHPWDFASWFYVSVRTGGAWDLKQCMGTDVHRQTDKVFRFGGK